MPYMEGRKDQLNTYPNSNYAAQLTHAAWDAAPYYDDDVYVRWECGCFNETKKDMEQRGRKMRNEREERTRNNGVVRFGNHWRVLA